MINIDNVVLINTRRLSIVIDKPMTLSIAFPSVEEVTTFLRSLGTAECFQTVTDQVLHHRVDAEECPCPKGHRKMWGSRPSHMSENTLFRGVLSNP
jgi:hypothetical protein